MLGGGYSLQTSASSSGGDTSREGQASGIVGNVVNLVSGKGNKLEADASASASPESKLLLWVLGGAAVLGLVVFLILRRK